jgi:hypothetical protein
MINIKFAIAEANSQAFFFSPLANRAAKVGINAEDNAPPATRLNNVSETLLAALKASISAWVPKAFATRICRASPVRLQRMNATITVPAARAICRLAARLVSLTFRLYPRISTLTPNKCSCILSSLNSNNVIVVGKR